MKDKIFGVLQRVGRSFMLPIAILPVAGLLLGLGSSFTNATTIATYGLQGILGEGTLLHSLLIIMNKVGSAIFDNLPLIFAVGVAIGMAKKEKEVAALSALIAYFVMHISINSMLEISGKIAADGTISKNVLEGTIASVCGINTLQMGVFGGIIVGLGVAALHNRFHKIVLPNALSFFGGSRFVPIISTITYMFVGIAMYFVWPIVQNGIYALGGLVTGTGYFGTLIFGIVKRALIPFGLHHVFYLPYLMGERSPHNDPKARATFIGMSMDTTREEMTQAVLEGVAFGLRDSLEVARSLGIKIERTKICGGGAKSPLWKKIIANVMNLKVDVLENEEGPSMGGAMLAAVGCGAYPDVETIGKKFAKVVDTVEPDPELVAKYEERYQKFRTLYPAMKPLF